MRARGPARPPGDRVVSPWRLLSVVLLVLLVLFRIGQAFRAPVATEPDAAARAQVAQLCASQEPGLQGGDGRPARATQVGAWIWRSSLPGPPAVPVVCRVENLDGQPRVTVTRE